MKIAFITFEYPPFILGGAGIYALNLTRELAKLGHQVVVFTPNILEETSKMEAPNLKIQKVFVNKKLPFKALQFWLRLPNEIKKLEIENSFDILHFNGISYWFLKKKLSKAKHIITIHHPVEDARKNNNLNFFSRLMDLSGENSYLIPIIERRCINSSEKIISVSHFTKKQIMESYKIDPNKIEVIYNGVDFKGYSFADEEITLAKRQLNLYEKQVILFVGRVDDPRKGLDLLLRSLKQVLQKLDVTLLVVGKGDQLEAKKLIRSLGISDKVVFTGFVEDTCLKKYYSICDIYVCSSRLEGFGLTLLEAMAAGKPIVTTNVGAIPEIFKDNLNGRLVDSGNIKEMSKIIYTLMNNYKLRDKIGKSNLHYVSEKFSWGKNAHETVRFYIK